MHFRAIDGLRAIAAYTVVFAHFLAGIPTLRINIPQGMGQLGVMLFFVISGFLMARLYLQTPFSVAAVGAFYRKRIARVFPLYLIIVFVSYASFLVVGPNRIAYNITNENFFLHAFFIYADRSILWTVPVEVHFYALFPLIWLAFSRIGPATVLWLLLASVAALSLRIGGTTLVSYIPFFLAGIATALVPSIERGATAAFLACAALYVLLSPAIFGNGPGMWFSPVYLLLVPAFVWSAVSSPFASRWLGSPAPRFLGDASYSAYLLHMPILKTIRLSPIMSLHPWLIFASAVAATVLLAYVSLILIERPLRRYIAGGDRKAPIGPPGALVPPRPNA